MKKALAWVLVLVLTAAIAVGGTLAYLTDTDEDVNVMTIGKVKIDQLEFERIDTETADQNATVQEFHDNKPLYPAVVEDGFGWTAGDSYVDWEQIGKDGYTSDIWDPSKINNEVDKMVFVKNKGDYDAYVRSVFAFEAGKYTTLDQFKQMVHLNLNNTDWNWEWMQDTPVKIGDSTYFVATATYNEVLKPGALTEISLSQIALDKTAGNADVEAFGETYHVLVKTQAIQAEGFTDAATALNEGFSEIMASNLPWTSDQPTKGIDVRSALRFYQGDYSQPIHNKVTNVVFGLNKDYPNVVDNYDGTLVTDEQDVDVYSYYVQDDDKYTVYFLANGRIYSPKNSSELFKDMTALQTVDTHNFDVSRTENMFRMYQNCSKLVEIDTSHWDTSNVTDMGRLFQACTILPYLDVSNWDTSNVVNMYCTFGGAETLNNLDVSDWNTSNVTNMEYTFWHCYSLGSVDVADWDVGKVTHFTDMFAGKHNWGNMKVVPEVENWDMSSAVSIRDMFYGCAQIKSLDLSKWDVSNLTDMRHTFADCFNLETINFSGWDTSKLTNLDGTFNDCMSLVDLDMSDFETHNVGTMAQLFEGCASLKTVKGMEKWDTSSLWEVEEMFYTNGRGSSLEYVDLSSFDTSKLLETNSMFGGCSELKTIYVGDGWDMSKVTVSGGMFSGCTSLVGENGTTIDGNPVDKTYACVDTPETPGYLTYKAAEENTNP